MKTEDRIQQEVFLHLHNNYECKGLGVVFAVPNQNQWKLTNIGVKAGVSDLIFVQQGRILFLEIKTDTGKQSEKQKQFQKQIESLGYEYYLIRSVEDLQVIGL
jgi:hypothetical protein